MNILFRLNIMVHQLNIVFKRLDRFHVHLRWRRADGYGMRNRDMMASPEGVGAGFEGRVNGAEESGYGDMRYLKRRVASLSG
jgi:hypothetical protein